MITVNYLGGTGNCLFQYSYGRLLADYLNQSFRAGRIEMFPELQAAIGHETPRPGEITINQTSKHNEVLTFDRISRMTDGFDISLEAYFEVGKIHYPYAVIIRKWFNPPEPQIDGTAVHVRGGDGEHNSPPASYYIEALAAAGIGPEQPFNIYTDDPDCAVVKTLRPLNCTVTSGTAAKDFQMMRRHKQLVIGNSTFGWWAAFLSDATMVVQPEPLHGFRSAEMPNSYLKIPAWKQIVYE